MKIVIVSIINCRLDTDDEHSHDFCAELISQNNKYVINKLPILRGRYFVRDIVIITR